MTQNIFNKVEEIFNAAVSLPETERHAYIVDVCGDDIELKKEVLSLIDSDQKTDFISSVIESNATQLDDVLDPWLGKTIYPYKISREIGSGGMGNVYLADRIDGQFKQVVAIKILSHGKYSKIFRQRFIAERQILADLNHENICQLIDGGTTEEGIPYLIMEYIEGLPIDQYADKNQLTIEQRIELLIKVCAALQYAHQNLVIHRDIKASNILVTDTGTLKLLDFGIAKILQRESTAEDISIESTQTAMRMLTPEYASPEQLKGEPVSTATDVYGVGILLFKLLTGSYPFEIAHSNQKSLEDVICHAEPPLPSASIIKGKDQTFAKRCQTDLKRLAQCLKGDIDNIILFALRKESARRYPTIDSLAKDLRHYIQGLPVTAVKNSFRYRAAKFWGRHALGVSASTMVISVFIGTLIFYTSQLKIERDQALVEKSRTRAVTGFLEDMLTQAAPAKTDGEKVTLLQLLEKTAKKVDSEIDDPHTEASIRSMLGKAYFSLGRAEEAEPHFRKALKLTHQITTPDDERYFGVVLELGDFLFRELGQFDPVQELLDTFIQHPKIVAHPIAQARLYHLQAELYLITRNNQVAKVFLTKMLEIEGANSDPDILHLANFSLATIELKADNYAAADYHFETAINIVSKHFGDMHYQLWVLWNNWALAKVRQGKMMEAKALYEKSLALNRKLHTGKHHTQAAVLHGLGVLYTKLEDYKKADTYHREALELQREFLPPNDYRVGIVLSQYARNLSLLKQYDKAEESYEECISIFIKSLGEEHRYTIRNQLKLAELYITREQYELVLAKLLVLAEKYSVQHGASSQHHIAAQLLVAKAYRLSADYSKTEQTLNNLQELFKEVEADSLPKERASLSEEVTLLAQALESVK